MRLEDVDGKVWVGGAEDGEQFFVVWLQGTDEIDQQGNRSWREGGLAA